jgi:hypothetical protein
MIAVINMAQILLTIASAIFLVLGTLHGVLTLRDVAKPRAFTPPDNAVRIVFWPRWCWHERAGSDV